MYIRILLFLFLASGSGAAIAQQKLQLIPAEPQRGEKLTIRYDPSAPGAKIPASADTVEMVFTYSNFYEYPWRIPMSKNGRYYEFSFVVPHYATFATFYLQSGTVKDQPASDKHFAIPVYKDGRRIENSYLYEQYSLQSQMGKVPELEAKKAELLEQELKEYPDNYEAKLRLLNYKMATGNDADKQRYREEARKVIADKFYEYPGKAGYMNKTTMGYLIIGENSRLDSIRKVVRRDFPESEVGYGMRISEIAQEEDTAVMARKMELLLRNERADNKAFFSEAHDRLFRHYASLKQKDKALYHLENIKKDFTPYTPEILKEQSEILLNAGIALDKALKLARHALVLSDTFEVGLTRHFPETGHIPSFVSREERKASTLKNTGIMKSVIALILNKQGFEQDAAANMAEALQLSEDPELLANAGKFYSETKQHDKAFAVYKKIMLQVPEDTVSLARMQDSYLNMGRSKDQWTGELDALNTHWKNEMLEELRKEIITEDAPDFVPALVDLSGKPVSKSILNNKVVVVNFWATWCVPCMKEMPYMQNAYTRYAGNKNVQFMVVNSGSNNSLDDARGWSGNKTYNFPVFYNKDRTIGTKFGFNVIPATYILDQEGKVRFEIIGFEGPVIQRKVEVAIDMLLNGA